MTIQLTTDLEEIVAKQVATGQYSTPSEVVREGLRLLSARDTLLFAQQEQLREDLFVGLAQAERGEVKPFDAASLLQRIEERFAGK